MNSGVDLRNMFSNATAFNQSLCDWSFQAPQQVDSMFSGATSCANEGNPTFTTDNPDATARSACHNCGRRLGTNDNIITVNNNNNNRINSRILQEGGGNTVAPFVTTIKFSTTAVNEDSAASAPFRRQTVVIATLAAVAVGFFL